MNKFIKYAFLFSLLGGLLYASFLKDDSIINPKVSIDPPPSESYTPPPTSSDPPPPPPPNP